MPRISQNATPRRGAPVPKLTRSEFVQRAGRGGSAGKATHTVSTPKPMLPTPIETGHKRS